MVYTFALQLRTV